jgi:hypothetical protein
VNVVTTRYVPVVALQTGLGTPTVGESFQVFHLYPTLLLSCQVAAFKTYNFTRLTSRFACLVGSLVDWPTGTAEEVTVAVNDDAWSVVKLQDCGQNFFFFFSLKMPTMQIHFVHKYNEISRQC